MNPAGGVALVTAKEVRVPKMARLWIAVVLTAGLIGCGGTPSASVDEQTLQQDKKASGPPKQAPPPFREPGGGL